MKLDNVFGMHEKAMLVHSRRLNIISANIANADTPNYKARGINFKKALMDAGEDMKKSIELKGRNPKHLTNSRYASDLTQKATYERPATANSMDGNTVEMNREQMKFADASLRYQAALRFLNGKISSIKKAMSPH